MVVVVDAPPGQLPWSRARRSARCWPLGPAGHCPLTPCERLHETASTRRVVTPARAHRGAGRRLRAAAAHRRRGQGALPRHQRPHHRGARTRATARRCCANSSSASRSTGMMRDDEGRAGVVAARPDLAALLELAVERPRLYGAADLLCWHGSPSCLGELGWPVTGRTSGGPSPSRAQQVDDDDRRPGLRRRQPGPVWPVCVDVAAGWQLLREVGARGAESVA